MKIKEPLRIHPTAIIEDSVFLEENVVVGPYTILRGNVRIGARTIIKERVTIEGNTTIGTDNIIFTGAVLGSETQDKKYAGGNSYLKIGNRNKFREYVTVNPGTKEGTETRIGDDNLMMAYAHVAHDCIVGNRVTMANVATLAGHVIVEDDAIIGGLSAVHQFIRIGSMSIIGGCSKVVQDIPPFMMADGHPARCVGINAVGLERKQVPAEERSVLKKAYKIIFRSKLSMKSILVELRKIESASRCLATLITFLETSDRGISG